MESRIFHITFSPTGASEKAGVRIARAFGEQPLTVDLCAQTPPERFFGANDLCVFSAPCYGGRIPPTAVGRLAGIRGSGTPAVVCVTFGNRAFEDALLELSDTVAANGFSVIAGCAVVTRHNIMRAYGVGRPNADDLAALDAFAAAAAEKRAADSLSCPAFPGKRPYRTYHHDFTPIEVEKSCTRCGLCERDCPVGAIDAAHWPADPGRCIGCMRCIARCPMNSRHRPAESLRILTERLRKACESPKPNAFFL